MSKWKTVRLGDVATYVNGFAFKPSDWTDTGLPIIRIQNLTGNDYETNYYSGEYNPKYEVVKGDILISWSASLGVYEWWKDKALLNQHIFKVVFDKVEIDKRYFIHTVSYLLDDMVKETHGSTMKHITKPRFDNTPFPYPPIETQRQIADTLDKLQSIITHRKQQLLKLDELVKARFVEMFGDPVENPLQWDTMALENACQSIVDCPHSTPTYTFEDTGYMCIRTSIVKKNLILWDKIEYIPKDEYEQRIKRRKPQKGDIIYTREGAILGIAAIIDRNCNVALGQRSMLLSPDTKICLPEFISNAMNFDSFLNRVTEGISGSASPHINVADIRAFNIMMPPLDLQEKFANFVQQTDKSKVAVQKALDEAQLLFDSLMQEYFG